MLSFLLRLTLLLAYSVEAPRPTGRFPLTALRQHGRLTMGHAGTVPYPINALRNLSLSHVTTDLVSILVWGPAAA